MTTHSTVLPDTTLPTARKSSPDERSAESGPLSSAEHKLDWRQAMNAGKTRVTEWRSGLQDGIRSKPIQSILIATAVGAVVGLLIGRRSR